MLIRGSNAVGYTSYPDNVVTEFVRLAAKNGVDVFRVFDCFNDVEQMRVCIDAVREAGKVAEVRGKGNEGPKIKHHSDFFAFFAFFFCVFYYFIMCFFFCFIFSTSCVE